MPVSRWSGSCAKACEPSARGVAGGNPDALLQPDMLREPDAADPFVGRDAEVMRACRLLDAGTTGLVLSGPPGVGRSRLGRAILDALTARGWSTSTVTATPALAAVPCGAIAHLLPESVGATPARLDLMRAAASGVRARAGGRRTAILVDDAHLLDPTSTTVLCSLVLGEAAVLVCTVRASVPAGRLVSLWRRDQPGWIDVEPLAEAAVAELVEALLGGQSDRGTSHMLTRLCGGNPSVLRALMLAGRRTGTLRRVGELWTMAQPPPVRGPLAEALGALIDTADPQARAVGEIVAFGEPIGLELLCRLVSLDSVVRAEAAGLVVLTTSGCRREVVTRDRLTGELLRATTPPIRSVRLHARLAEVCGATGLRRRGDALQVGLWMANGLVPPAAEPLLRAAREAAQQFDHPRTVQLVTAAERAGATPETTVLGAAALVWLGRGAEAEGRFAGLAAAVPELADRSDIAFVRAVNLWLGLHRSADAESVLTRAEQHTSDPSARAQLHAARALGLSTVGQISRAVAECEPWLAQAATPVARGHVVPVLVDALAHHGCTRRAVSLSEGFVDQWPLVARRHPYLRDGLAVAHAVALLLDGRYDEVVALATTRYDEALLSGHEQSRAVWAYVRGRVALFRGHLTEVLRWQREAVMLMTRTMTLSAARGMFGAYADLAEVHALCGQVAAARRALADGERRAPDGMVVAPTETARAWLAAAEGDRADACARLEDIAGRSGAVGWYGLTLRALHNLARLGAPERAVAELDRLRDVLDSGTPARYAAHVRALVDGCASALQAAAEQFVAAGERLLAAEAFAAAAARYRGTGQRAPGALCAERARQLYRWCGPVRVPEPAPQDGPDSLSPRERELSTMVARGLSNRQIAELLSLSVRTVENHLHRIYAKLGLDNRAHLAGVVVDTDRAG